MADRTVVLKLNLRPGDTAELDRAFDRVNSRLNQIDSHGRDLFNRGRGSGFGQPLGHEVGPDKSGVKAKDVLGAQRSAAESVEADIEKMVAELHKLAAAMDPDAVKKRVDLEKQLADARANLNKALEKERTEQWEPKSVFGALAKSVGGKAPGPAAAKGEGGMAQSALEMFGVGGEEGAGALVGELGSLSAAAGPAGIAVAAAAAACAAAYEAFEKLTQAAIDFGGAASPGAVERYNLALRDTSGVIGSRLLPLLNLMTDGERLLGDVLQTILPDTQDFADALSPFGEALGEVRDLMGTLAPFIKDDLVVALKLFSAATQAMLFPLVLVTETMKALGLMAGDLKSSVAAAYREIHFTGQDQAAREVYQAAYRNVGPGAKASVETPMEKTAKQIAKDVAAILQIMGGPARATGAAAAAAAHPAAAAANPVGTAAAVWRALMGY